MIESDVPTLILSGSHDPVTPASGGEELARHLSNSKHVVVEGAGHGIFGDCVGQMQLDLVETGSVEGLDDSCLEAIPPTEFVVAEEG